MLDLSEFKGKPGLQCVNALGSDWGERTDIPKEEYKLEAPGEGHWIALIQLFL